MRAAPEALVKPAPVGVVAGGALDFPADTLMSQIR
jgi:hypothetical protein